VDVSKYKLEMFAWTTRKIPGVNVGEEHVTIFAESKIFLEGVRSGPLLMPGSITRQDLGVSECNIYRILEKLIYVSE
jgi:hypothetical protein